MGESLPNPTDSNRHLGVTNVVIPDRYTQPATLKRDFLEGPVDGPYKGEDKELRNNWSAEQVMGFHADLGSLWIYF